VIQYHGVTQNNDTPESKDRKERVLHTRVPAVLEEELKRLAEALRLPVSNLVRTILEDAISAVDVVGRRADKELRGVAERLAAERDRLKGGLERWQRPGRAEPTVAEPEEPLEPPLPEPGPEPSAGVLGWHPLILATARTCARCSRRLEAGASAYLGISANGQPAADGGLVIGSECLSAARTDQENGERP
jgi:hypothetical protein